MLIGGQEKVPSALVGSAVSRATIFIPIDIRVFHSVVALLIERWELINNSITTVWVSAVGTAGIGGVITVVESIVALLTSISDTISTSWQLAVVSAGILDISIHGSVITLLERSNLVVSALTAAFGIATVFSDTVSVITFLSEEHIIDNTITTLGDSTVVTARSVGVVAVQDSGITLLTKASVHGSISTAG